MVEETKVAPALQSSIDPTKIGNTVRGISLLVLSPVVLQLASAMFGIAVPSTDVTLIADDIANIATQVSMVAGLVWSMYGLVMKVLNRVNSWLITKK